MNKQKTIFLDRDGTLIIDKVYLNDPDQIEYLPGVFDALCLLRDNGYQFIIVTNQSGVARGLVTIENLDETHRRIAVAFEKVGVHFAEFYYAPYSVESNHQMRKPNPGMLLAGERDHHADLTKSWMIGDRMTDVEAGFHAGCRTVLLEGTDSPDQSKITRPTIVAGDLLTAAQLILKCDRKALQDCGASS